MRRGLTMLQSHDLVVVTSEIDGVVKAINDPNSSASDLSDNSSDAYITILEVGGYRVKGTINEQNISQIPGMPFLMRLSCL